MTISGSAREAARQSDGKFGIQAHGRPPRGLGEAAIPVHKFEDSGSGYDRTQWDDSIHDGDILVVESEGVVGFLSDAWPIAVSEEKGNFHGTKDGKEAFLEQFPKHIEVWQACEDIIARQADGTGKKREKTTEAELAEQMKALTAEDHLEILEEATTIFSQKDIRDAVAGGHLTHEDIEKSIELHKLGMHARNESQRYGRDAATENAAICSYSERVMRKALDRSLQRRRNESGELIPDPQGGYFSVRTDRDGFPDDSIRYYRDCRSCDAEKAKNGGMFPPHSSRLGHRPHCSCDSCF